MEKQEKAYNAENIFIATRVLGSNILHYELNFANYHYDVFYEHGCVKIEKGEELVFFQQISQQDDELWDDNETDTYLHWIKEAVRDGTIEVLKIPRKGELLIKE